MKSNKLVVILISFILSCSAAYAVGQKVVLPLSHKSVADTDVKTEYSFADHFDSLTFENKKEVDTVDIPWGSTVARIQDEEAGPSIMMVQGTGLRAEYHVKENESIRWDYAIHPWVSENSDGMTLYVRVYAAGNENAGLRRSYIVKPDDGYTSVVLPLNEFTDQDVTIYFSADNGGNGDDAGDWLVLSKLNVVSGIRDTESEKDQEAYWVAAHYFADAWPANMWDSEFENIDADLQRIKTDGFNSIILIVPWRQFQPGIGKTNRYNSDAFEKLDMILGKADEHHLGVILRIGYTWDYYQNRGNDDIIERYENIVNDQRTRNAWIEYVERVYSVAAAHESFWGGFICWEDFWNLTTKMKTISGKNAESLKYAARIGFSRYMAEYYEISDIRRLYDDDKLYSEEDLYIPTEDKQAFKMFYDFYDSFLNELLAYSQTAFPNLSMEVRVDDDWIVNEDGENRYYSHAGTYPCHGSAYTTIMYGIPMGMVNNGEKVTWKKALSKTDEILEKVKQGAEGKRIFIDQFLYYDNTQVFSHNAQLLEDQIDDYLIRSAKTLEQYTNGYGIWVYRDYYMDTIANGSFADGLNGWVTGGEVMVKRVDGNNKCLLVDHAQIEQNVSGKVTNTTGKITCRFDASIIEKAFTLKFSMSGEEKEILVTEDGTYYVEFEGDEWDTLTITSEGEGFVDNIKLYNFCQQGLLYDVDGNERELISAMRELNGRMAAE